MRPPSPIRIILFFLLSRAESQVSRRRRKLLTVCRRRRVIAERVLTMFRGPALLALFLKNAFGLSAWLAATSVDEPIVNLRALLVIVFEDGMFHCGYIELLLLVDIDVD